MDTSASDELLLTKAGLTRTLLNRRVAGGWWEGRLSSSALATATAVTAIATAERAGRRIDGETRFVSRGIGWLLETQNRDGGWGDTPDSPSNISTTALGWAALSFGESTTVREAASRAEGWLAPTTGGAAERQGSGVEPRTLAAALAARYGKDRTFSVPILTMCAIAGRLGPGEAAWQLIPRLPFELAVLPRGLFGALRLPVVSYALPALISMGLARHRRGTANPLVSSVRERAASRALRVLEGLQPPNGGFLEAVPLTSFVAMSLVAAGESAHPVVGSALEFLTRSAREDGSWPIDTNLSTWVTTLSVNALAADGTLDPLSEEERHRIRDWLLDQQWTIRHPYTSAAPGGWAWTDLPGGVPDADDTSGALVALAHLDSSSTGVRQAAAAGVRWLLDLQNRDGGIPTFCRGWGTLPFDRSATDLTAHALRAWSSWLAFLEPPLQQRTRRAMRRANRFLARSQRADGAFVPLWFGSQLLPGEANPVYGTARVLKGLAAMAEADQARSVRSMATGWLLRGQNGDGGWGADVGAPSSIEETAVAVAALSAIPDLAEGDRQSVHRGLEWLAAATQGFRRFPASPVGLYFARLWYFEELYPIIFCVEAARAASSRAPGSA